MPYAPSCIEPAKTPGGCSRFVSASFTNFKVLRYRMSHEPLCNTNIVGQKKERARTFQCFSMLIYYHFPAFFSSVNGLLGTKVNDSFSIF